MRRTDIEFRNRAVRSLRIQRVALIKGQESNNCFTVSRKQYEIGAVNEPGTSSSCRVVLMKVEDLFFYGRHDFAEQLSDHGSDDIRIFRLSGSNPNSHSAFLTLSSFRIRRRSPLCSFTFRPIKVCRSFPRLLNWSRPFAFR